MPFSINLSTITVVKIINKYIKCMVILMTENICRPKCITSEHIGSVE